MHKILYTVFFSFLFCSKIKSSEFIDDKNISVILKFAISLIHGFKIATDGMKGRYMKVLAAVLDVISTLKLPCIADEMRELILELQILFMASSDSADVLYQCRPSLVSFMVSLSQLEIPDGEGSELYSALLSFYHVFLRERHWAFNHLAIGAFANFAASTSCSQLWRFIPDDAALSFDTSTGKEADEERFMAELKAYLEKEVAVQELTCCSEQLHHLVVEGKVLRKLSNVPVKVTDVAEDEIMEIVNDECVNKKKRKLPNGVCEGLVLLQSGLMEMDNALAQTDSAELNDMFLPHISCLKDVISHLAGLSDSM